MYNIYRTSSQVDSEPNIGTTSLTSSQTSNTIDKQLKQEEKKTHSQVKLLLLGSSVPWDS